MTKLQESMCRKTVAFQIRGWKGNNEPDVVTFLLSNETLEKSIPFHFFSCLPLQISSCVGSYFHRISPVLKL